MGTTGGSDRHQHFIYENINVDNNGGIGLSVTMGSGFLVEGVFFRVLADTNTGDGIDYAGGSVTRSNLTMYSSISQNNGGIGYDINLPGNTFVGCFASSNTGDGFEDSQSNLYIGCTSDNNGSNIEWDMTSNSAIIGNSLFRNNTLSPATQMSLLNSGATSLNANGSSRNWNKMFKMRNRSGGTLAAGDVVIFASNADGESITTTTTQGDDKIFGMVLESIINNAIGNVLIEGYTTQLKVNGTTDIAVGDLLGTFTSAGIAMKAAAGDMCFAIALEAYIANDSLGVIDALLISPRLI